MSTAPPALTPEKLAQFAHDVYIGNLILRNVGAYAEFAIPHAQCSVNSRCDGARYLALVDHAWC